MDREKTEKIQEEGEAAAETARPAEQDGKEPENRRAGRKDPGAPHRGSRVLRTVTAIVLTAAICASAVFAYEIRRYENGILDVCAEQQDSYVRLVMDQIHLKTNRSDAKIIREIIGTLDASGGRYWTFAKGENILFVKNVLETNRYKGLNASSYFSGKSASAFLRSLRNDQVRHAAITVQGKEYIASGAAFTYRNRSYRLVLLTSPSVILENNDYLSARTGLITVYALLLVLFVLLAMILAWKYRALDRQDGKKAGEILRLNRTITELGEYVSAKLFAMNRTEEERMKQVSYRYYILKFYLNAAHYIIIDGKKGELHPHTWEFSLEFGLPRDSFQEFGTVEKRIQDYLEPYQNRVLNEIRPFDAVVPVVENLAEYFTKGFRERIAEFGGVLRRVETAETPTRIYVIDLSEQE